MRSCPCSNVAEKYESSHWLPFGRRPSREEGLISVITNGNILYLVTFKWLLTGAYGLPHTFNALTQYISYFNCLVYNVFLLFFFSSQNFRRGGALAPCIDAPPLVTRAKKSIILSGSRHRCNKSCVVFCVSLFAGQEMATHWSSDALFQRSGAPYTVHNNIQRDSL